MARQRSGSRGPGRIAQEASRPAAPEAKVGEGGGWRATLIETAGGLVAAPIIGLVAGFLLLFGGIFLAIAWSTGPQPLLDSYAFQPFTSRVEGRIVDSWAAVEFDPADVPKDKLYWQPVSKISPCVVIEYAGDWGAASRRAFCGNRFSFSEDFRLDDWTTLAPGVPFAFARDSSGFAVGELRVSKVTLDWISTHAPNSTFMLSKPPPTTALGALKEQFDRPREFASASWSTPFPSFPLAFDPKHPDQAMPAKWVEQKQTGFWWGSLVFTLILCVPGILVWRLGVSFLTGQSGLLAWVLTLAPLLAMPWWNELLPQILQRANRNWAEIGSMMLDDINRVTRLRASAPADALLADGERLVWRVQSGAYADTFGRMRFVAPSPLPKTPDRALAALREQASAQMAKLESAERGAIFLRLRQQSDAFARDVQSVFTSAAEDTLRDPSADTTAHRAAKEFLIFASGGSYYEDQLDAMEKAAAQAQYR